MAKDIDLLAQNLKLKGEVYDLREAAEQAAELTTMLKNTITQIATELNCVDLDNGKIKLEQLVGAVKVLKSRAKQDEVIVDEDS